MIQVPVLPLPTPVTFLLTGRTATSLPSISPRSAREEGTGRVFALERVGTGYARHVWKHWLPRPPTRSSIQPA